MRKNSFPRHRSWLVIGVIAVLAAAAVSSRDTWATYTSQAVSGKNIMRGGSIELSVSPDVLPDSRRVTLAAGSKRSYGITVKNDGRNALGYRSRFIADGDPDFCEVLHLTARRMDEDVYAGRLVDFEYTSEVPLERHQTDKWQFSIGIPESVSGFGGSATCDLRWRADAWQNRFLALGMGWYDGVEGGVFALSIEPDQDSAILEVQKSTLPDSLPVVSVASETVITDDPFVPIVELFPDPEITPPTTTAEITGEVKGIE